MTKDECFRNDMRLAHNDAAKALALLAGAMAEDDFSNPLFARQAATILEESARRIRSSIVRNSN